MNLETSNTIGNTVGLGANFSAPTYYDILNVDRNAARFTIRESYLRLKNLYSNGGDGLYGLAGAEDLNRHLEELEKAFAVLNDDAQRAGYDRQLASANLSEQPGAWVDRDANWQTAVHNAGTEVVQTSRSVLKVTRTQATGTRDDNLQASMLSIMEEGDVGDGSILAALREAAGVTHAEIQERTKISLEYIRSMETNQFDRLPRVVYVKGFMRSFLRYLNVPNAEKIVLAYVARLEAYQAGQK